MLVISLIILLLLPLFILSAKKKCTRCPNLIPVCDAILERGICVECARVEGNRQLRKIERRKMRHGCDFREKAVA